jgi:hypothetical protein
VGLVEVRASWPGHSHQTKKKEANGAFVCSSIVEDDICFVLADD